MLAVARRKVARAGLDARVTLRGGVAEALPFPDGHFDGVSIAFGVRNARDRMQALREMGRVTRAGGRVAVLELSEPRRGVLGPLVRWHIRAVVPRLGAWLSGWREYRYLQTSVAAFPPPEEFADMMRAAGLRVLQVRPMTFGSCCLYVGTPAAGAEVAP
jgi:demethylmenaquinone methyltransferase/2-methoxy-6-polyprenyl-1,4-benzoquinol methylase